MPDTLNNPGLAADKKMINKADGLIPALRFPEFREGGEWKDTLLFQVANYENGKAHEKNISENGKYIVVNSKYISSDGETRKYTNKPFCLAEKGDTLMVLSDVPNGKAIAKCFFVDQAGKYTVNQRISKLTPFDCVNRFLFYIMNRNSYFLAYDDGVKQTNLKTDDVNNFSFLLPKNKQEQQKIAACLSSLDELLTVHKDKLAALKEHKKGLMQNLFPHPSTSSGYHPFSTGPLRHAQGKQKNKAHLPNYRFPEFEGDGEWVEKPIDEVCQVNPSVGDLPNRFIYVDLESVSKGILVKRNIINKKDAPSRAQRCLQHKDVIYQTVRPYQKNNYFFLSSNDYEFVASTGYAQLRALESSQYLYQLIHTDKFVSSVLDKCTGSNYPAINSSALKKIKVDMPPTIKEQHKITACLSAVDELITKQIEKIAQLQKHKKGLMQSLFPKFGR